MIPKIIHHIWASDTAAFDDRDMMHWQHQARSKHGAWDYRFWRLKDLPARNMDPWALEIAMSPDYTVIVKADVLRWEILRLYGGIYLDTDVEVLSDLGDYLEAKALLVGLNHEQVLTCVLGFEADDPMVAECAKIVIEGAKKKPAQANNEPHHVTGMLAVSPILRASGYPILERSCCLSPDDKEHDRAIIRHHQFGTRPDGWQHRKRFS